MANLTITNIDNGSPVIVRGAERDELLTLAGADSIAAGTILARDTGTNKLVLFVKGGITAGNGVPKAVLAYSVTSTGAGDVPVRAVMSGVVNGGRLVIDADGDATNVDAVVRDQLRDYGIDTVTVTELNKLDNQ